MATRFLYQKKMYVNYIVLGDALFNNLSRLAQSVERQTLKRVSLVSRGYLNVVGSSPTLGAVFCLLYGLDECSSFVLTFCVHFLHHPDLM